MKVRKSIPSATDPYLPSSGSRGTAVCRVCGSIYHHKRWDLEPTVHLGDPTLAVVRVVCPACRKIRDRFPGGIVTLRGDFLRAHKDQVLRLVRNVERRASEVNPLQRIISIRDWGDGLEIRTTNERLAQRIGRELERACKGEVTYRWSRDNKFVRVEWNRVAGKGKE